MSTSAEPTTNVTKPAFVFDEAKTKAKLDKLEKDIQAKSGKAGYNPHLFYQLYILPLVTDMINNEKTEELYNKIMSLPNEIPLLKNMKQ